MNERMNMWRTTVRKLVEYKNFIRLDKKKYYNNKNKTISFYFLRNFFKLY